MQFLHPPQNRANRRGCYLDMIMRNVCMGTDQYLDGMNVDYGCR